MTGREQRRGGWEGSAGTGGVTSDSASGRQEPAAPRRTLAAPDGEIAALAQVKHELRTLLTGIVGSSDLLLETELDRKQRAWARHIRSRGDAALSMIDDLVDLGEVERGELRLDPVDLDLRRTVEEVAEVLAERAHDGGTELVLDLRPDVPGAVRGDAARLRRILMNLGTDAIRAAPRGEVLLHVAVDGGAHHEGNGAPGGAHHEGNGAPGGAHHEGNGAPADAPEATRARVRFDVRRESAPALAAEQGVGQAVEARSEPEPAEGASLGVAVARRLVRAMGGELLEPPCGGVGRGASSFALPLERRGRGEGRGLIPRIDLPGKRVLVVDDRVAARRVAQAMVEELGLQCSASASGAAALSALREAVALGAAYDTVLIAVDLRDLDGPSLLRRIKLDPAIAPVRSVLMTPPGHEAHARAEADAVLGKPVRRAHLHSSLRLLMGLSPEHLASCPRSQAPRSRRTPAQPPPLRPARSSSLVADGSMATPKSAGYEAAPGSAALSGETTGPPSWRPTPPPSTEAPARPAASSSGLRRSAFRAVEPDVVTEIIELFFTEAPARISEMRAAAERGALGELSRLARSLHESADKLSALSLKDLCARLDREARAGTPENAAEATRAIAREVGRVQDSLAPELRKRGLR